MKFVKGLFVLLVAAGLLHGCGGGSGAFQCTSNCGTSSSGGSSSGGSTSPEEMGATVNGKFQVGVIGTALPSGSQLPTGGSTQLSLQFVVTSTGAAATDDIVVTFSSLCPAGTVTITPATANAVATSATAAKNVGGSISATYASAGGCGLTQDTVTAQVTSGGTLLTNQSATATIALAQAQANSIVFLSAKPTNIGLQGTGQPSSSVVTFKVVTAAGGPVANAKVDFALSTTLGGVSLVNTTAQTGTDGTASTTVQAGTRAQVITVTATTQVASGPITASSNSLTVTTGIPDAQNMSLAVACNNVEAFDVDGVQVSVTMRMKDRFSNPVPDGTPVTFATSGGGITGQCLTQTVTGTGNGGTEGGLCTVTWNSQNPRPPAHGNYGAGRAVILGVAVGEKHFTDQYGLGYFIGPPDPTATKGADPITPNGDPYLDANENGQYDLGETYFDIHNSTTYQPDNGEYVGLLCGGPSPTTLPTLCGGNANSTMYVGSQNIIVMSTSSANIGIVGATPVDLTSGASVVITVTDRNGNPMPAGTTVAVSGAPSGVTVTGPTSYTIGCETTAQNPFVFVLSDPSPAHLSTNLTITVTTPGVAAQSIAGTATIRQVPVLY